VHEEGGRKTADRQKGAQVPPIREREEVCTRSEEEREGEEERE